jgi:hypothetical protein
MLARGIITPARENKFLFFESFTGIASFGFD